MTEEDSKPKDESVPVDTDKLPQGCYHMSYSYDRADGSGHVLMAYQLDLKHVTTLYGLRDKCLQTC